MFVLLSRHTKNNGGIDRLIKSIDSSLSIGDFDDHRVRNYYLLRTIILVR